MRTTILFSLLLLASCFTLKSQDNIPYLDVMFVYPSSIASYDSINQIVDERIEAVNIMYENSQVRQRMRKAGIHVIDDTEFTEDQRKENNNRFIQYFLQSPYLTRIVPNEIAHEGKKAFVNMVQKRYDLKADVVVYLDYPDQDYNSGANSYGNPYLNFVRMCIKYFFADALAHEVGHLQGLSHTMGASVILDKENKIGYRSLMSKNCLNMYSRETVDLFSGKHSYYKNELLYKPCTWDAVDHLNQTAVEFCSMGDSVAAGKVYNLEQPESNVRQVSLGGECLTIAVLEDNTLWKWNNSTWVRIQDHNNVKQAEVSKTGLIFVLTNDNELSYIPYNGIGKKLITTAFNISEFAVGELEIWAISDNGKLYRKQNQYASWQEINHPDETAWRDLSIGNDDAIWMVSESGRLYRWLSDTLVYKNQNNLKSVSSGIDKTLVTIDMNNLMKISTEEEPYFKVLKTEYPICACDNFKDTGLCFEIDNGYADKVSVYDKERIWVQTDDSCLFSLINQSFYLPVRDLRLRNGCVAY